MTAQAREAVADALLLSVSAAAYGPAAAAQVGIRELTDELVVLASDPKATFGDWRSAALDRLGATYGIAVELLRQLSALTGEDPAALLAALREAP